LQYDLSSPSFHVSPFEKGGLRGILVISPNGASKRGADPSFIFLPPSLNAKGRGIRGIGYKNWIPTCAGMTVLCGDRDCHVVPIVSGLLAMT